MKKILLFFLVFCYCIETKAESYSIFYIGRQFEADVIQNYSEGGKFLISCLSLFPQEDAFVRGLEFLLSSYVTMGVSGFVHEKSHLKGHFYWKGVNPSHFRFSPADGEGREYRATDFNIALYSFRMLGGVFSTKVYLIGDNIPQKKDERVETFSFAAGLNSQQWIAHNVGVKDIAHHPLLGVMRIYNDFATLGYSWAKGEILDRSGDISNYCTLLGKKTTVRNIQLYSQLIKLVSRTNWIAIGTLWDWLLRGKKGDGWEDFLTWKIIPDLQLIAPDFEVYLTLKGVQSGIIFPLKCQWGDFSLGVFYNKIFTEGISGNHEIWLSWKKMFFLGGIKSQIALNSGIWLEGELYLKLPYYLRRISIGLNVYWAKGYTIMREIRGNYPYFRSKEEIRIKAFIAFNLDF